MLGDINYMSPLEEEEKTGKRKLDTESWKIKRKQMMGKQSKLPEKVTRSNTGC